jgi:hypothetical protein
MKGQELARIERKYSKKSMTSTYKNKENDKILIILKEGIE